MPEFDNMPKILNDLSAEFDQFVQARHEMGSKSYGPFAFLSADIIQETLQELGDIANYVRYQYIKLRLLQLSLEEDPRLAGKFGDDQRIVVGLESFKGNL